MKSPPVFCLSKMIPTASVPTFYRIIGMILFSTHVLFISVGLLKFCHFYNTFYRQGPFLHYSHLWYIWAYLNCTTAISSCVSSALSCRYQCSGSQRRPRARQAHGIHAFLTPAVFREGHDAMGAVCRIFTKVKETKIRQPFSFTWWRCWLPWLPCELNPELIDPM